MPAKRKLVAEANIEPASVPSPLPPSVEEAYRRKCVQLKNRTNEVEDANDAARLRLARIKRQVEKLRIERAFLLEQLAKRTSTNVEDSEGSPSPPPTPKDKPLRIKKGHRKSNAPADADAKQGSAKEPASPTSESNSQAKGSRANGVSKASVEYKDPFELYCEDARPALEAKNKDDADVNIEEELSRAWEELPEAEKEEYQTKFDEITKSREEEEDEEEEEKNAAEAEAEAEAEADADADADVDADVEAEAEAEADADNDIPKKSIKAEPETDKSRAHDEDVEMSNYDTEDQETQDKDGDE